MEQTLLADKYRLVSLLGRGGMGSVWRGEHLALKAPIAIKLMDPSIAEAPEALSRFHREAQSAAALRSPHVVQILDHGVDVRTNTPFIVMELLDGESLSDRIKRFGQLDPQSTSRVITQVARALTKAHAAGIVHRDLKPDNIFLVKNEDEEIAKVLDFGIAKSESHALVTATVTGAVMGTAYYMSPEQISGAKDVDFRSDLWALGVIAHECLVGLRPFEADTLGAMVLRICTQPVSRPSSVGRVPEGFDQWFERAVSRDPNQRFQSARELADALKVVCRATLLLGDSLDLASSKTVLGDTGQTGKTASGGTASFSQGSSAGFQSSNSGVTLGSGAGRDAELGTFPNTANPVSHSTDSAVAHLRANRGGLAWGLMFGGGLLVTGLAALGAWSLLRTPHDPSVPSVPTTPSLAMAPPPSPSVAVVPVANKVPPSPPSSAATDTTAASSADRLDGEGDVDVAPSPSNAAKSARGGRSPASPRAIEPAPPVSPAPVSPPAAVKPAPPAAKPIAPPPGAAPKPEPSPFDGVLRTRK